MHNLAYFYNWSFAHVQTAYSMKWDGDMVLTAEGVDTYADLAWQLENVEAVVSMPRHPLFVESDRVAYLDVYMINVEEYVFPMGETTASSRPTSGRCGWCRQASAAGGCRRACAWS